MHTLAGKTAFVSAAGQGIGRASALAFAKAGATVFATDINKDLLDSLPAGPAFTTRVLDARDGAALQAMAKDTGPLDILFNCAGFVHHGTVLDNSEEDWDFAFDLNVKAMYRAIRVFLPAMIDNGGGSIINMASVVSTIKGAPNRCIYGASKAAVMGLTRSVAADFVTKGIRCNAICPGTVETPSLDERLHAFDDYEQARRDFTARQPMGRLASPDEIAALVVYLASDASAFTTGTMQIIDGGWSV